MSRIGNQPIKIPTNVKVDIAKDNRVTIQGPKGSLTQYVKPQITVAIEDQQIVVKRPTDQKNVKALHGLYRVLLNNMIIGVTQGFKKSLEVVGIGYKAEVVNQILELQLDKSHTIQICMPPHITVSAEVNRDKKISTYVHIEGIDKQLVGQMAMKIRDQKPPEAYISKRGNTQKGIRYTDELLIGKTKKDGK